MRIELYVVTTNLYKNLNYLTYEEKTNIEKLEKVKAEIIKEFGGLTVIPNNKGFWINDSNQMVSDNVDIWLIFTYNCCEKSVNAYSLQIKAITTQCSQLYVIDNKSHMV